MADVTDVSGRPDPAAARTPAEFVEAMRRLKRWTGFGFRQLEKRATAGGHALPRSTLTVALARDTVPREDLVAAFAHACGCDEDQTAGWVAARRRVAAAGVQDAPEPDQPTVEQPALTQPPPGRRRARRLVPALLALALALTAVTYLLSSSGRPDERQGADNNAAPPPDSSRARTPRRAPGSGTATPEGEPGPTTQTSPGDPGDLGGLVPIALDTPSTPKPSGQPQPGPPPTDGTPPREPGPGPGPDQAGRATIPIEGEPPIHCPMPYLNTMYGALAQCTQQSGGQARIGFYSPYTQNFGSMVDWTELTEDRWFEGSMLATDGVQAEVRGYAVLNTTYGPGVFATQYLDGKARWGTANLYTNEFHPGEVGWQDIAT